MYIPPAGAGSVAPPSPTSGVVIGSSDQLSFDYIIGKTILGGTQFSDTLGNFYPIVIRPSGGLVLNASTTTWFLTFHDTAAVHTDIVVGLGSGALFITPNQATSIGTTATLVVNDRAANPSKGFWFYPGYTNGSLIAIGDGAGGLNTIYQYGANYIAIGGAAAGTEPTISALGADTDIYIYLYPKGAGTVGFQYAATALGGGAAPTLGTIGGSGPATAGQNSWLKVVVNGSFRWIPLWA